MHLENNQRTRILITALAVALVMVVCLGLAILPTIQDIVREGLILPVIYAVWLVGLGLRAIDQVVLWAIGLGLLSLLMLWGLALAWTDRSHRPKSRSFDEIYPPQRSGRVIFWTHNIASLRSQGLSSPYATQDFRRLAKGVEQIASIQEQSPENQPPEAIQPFFREAQQPFDNGLVDGSGLLARLNRAASWLKASSGRLKGWFGRRRAEPPELDDPLHELCVYLETQLETEHEHTD